MRTLIVIVDILFLMYWLWYFLDFELNSLNDKLLRNYFHPKEPIKERLIGYLTDILFFLISNYRWKRRFFYPAIFITFVLIYYTFKFLP